MTSSTALVEEITKTLSPCPFLNETPVFEVHYVDSQIWQCTIKSRFCSIIQKALTQKEAIDAAVRVWEFRPLLAQKEAMLGYFNPSYVSCLWLSYDNSRMGKPKISVGFLLNWNKMFSKWDGVLESMGHEGSQ